MFTPKGKNVDINALLFPIQYGMLHFAGLVVLPPFIAYGAARCHDGQRTVYLDQYAAQLRAIGNAVPLRFDAEQFATF